VAVRKLGRVLVCSGGALLLAVGLVACDDPPTSERVVVAHSCKITSSVGDTTGTAESTFDTTALQAVKPGAEFDVELKPAPFSPDGTPTSDGTLAEVSAIASKIAVPAGTTLVSYSIANWSNVGAGTPTATASGGVITVTTPGPIRSSTASSPNVATLPTLTLKLKATGVAGSRINVAMAGTSTSNPGLTFKAKVTGTLIGTLTPTLSCYPNPNKVLHSTLISNDTKAPAITIAKPVDGSKIVRNATVLADFSCDDGGGVGVQSCVGTVAKGTKIDTATLGTKSFTVTATDKEGKVGTKTVTYSVVAA
jgi:hypothetical protein